jgi:hypothetical protein
MWAAWTSVVITPREPFSWNRIDEGSHGTHAAVTKYSCCRMQSQLTLPFHARKSKDKLAASREKVKACLRRSSAFLTGTCDVTDYRWCPQPHGRDFIVSDAWIDQTLLRGWTGVWVCGCLEASDRACDMRTAFCPCQEPEFRRSINFLGKH